jgi:hypothetical protein
LTIRVAPRAAELAADLAGSFLVVVRRVDDTDAALRGLDAARRQLLEADGRGDEHASPMIVSPVVLSPEGPLLRVGDLDLDEEGFHGIPELVAQALHRAGVTEGRVDVLEPRGPLEDLDQTAGAVVLRVFPAPAGAEGVLPPQWMEVAADFVLGDAQPRELVAVRLLGAPFSVAGSDAVATLHAANAARTWCDVAHGDLRRRVRTASLTYGRAPHLALAAGGPKCDVPALLARFDLLCELARDLRPEAAYACVDFEPTFGAIGRGLSTAGWRAHGGASPNAVAAEAGDVAVPDAFPYQLLGPGHRARRKGRGPVGARLDDDRVELSLGEPLDWLPIYDTREDAREEGWTALEGLLLTERELAELVLQRAHPLPVADGPPSAVRAGPDLDDIVLEPLPHPRRGLHLTLLELAAWLGHDAHSDAPATVSPVLAAYGRWLAQGLDDEERQRLKRYAARLVGTHDARLSNEDWRPLAPVDDTRAWMAADALARVQAPAWLRAAGLDRAAERITKVRPRKDRSHLPRLLTALTDAIDELGRVSDDGTWEAWERASEASGWVAASEAALVGVPDALAVAAEQRVVELARHRPTAPDCTDGSHTLVAAVRRAAVAAAAQAAWEDAGRRAAAVVDATERDEVHDIALHSAVERSRGAAGRRLGLDRDALDQALEQADAAALAELGRLVHEPAAGPGAALDEARRAAAASTGGTVWSEVQALTQGVVGDEAWAAALAAGRVAVDRVLQTAAGLVERAVVVAVAREVAGLAARTVVHAEGRAGVDEVVAELQAEAFALLDDLLDVRDPARRGRPPRRAALPA